MCDRIGKCIIVWESVISKTTSHTHDRVGESIVGKMMLQKCMFVSENAKLHGKEYTDTSHTVKVICRATNKKDPLDQQLNYSTH